MDDATHTNDIQAAAGEKREPRKLYGGSYARVLGALSAKVAADYGKPNAFAVKNGIHTTKVYNAFSGKSAPLADEFFRWADILGVLVLVGPDLDKLNEHFVPVPKVSDRPVEADGGLRTEAVVDGFYGFRQEWLQRRAPGGGAVLLEAAGDSMAPTVLDGDMVLVDTGQCDVVAGRIYMVRVEDTIMLRRLEKLPGRLCLRSDNPVYTPVEIPLDQVDNTVQVMGRVIWAAKEL